MPSDPFDLERFVDAQAAVFDDVLAELARGKKTTHWMWFVFPQLKALGRSVTARKFGISGIEEAAAYLRHPILGLRLRQCIDLLLALDSNDAHAIFGSPDDLKLRSCLTLFTLASQGERRFRAALLKFYVGVPDETTTASLDLSWPPTNP